MFIEWQVHLVLHLFAFFIHMHNWVICMCLKPDDMFRIVTQIVKECLTIVAYFEPKWIHSTPHHPICLRDLLIPFFYLCVDFKVIPFLQIFWAKLVCIYFPILICAPLSCDGASKVWWAVQVLKLLIMQFCRASNYFLLGPNILLSSMFSNQTPSICVLPLRRLTKCNTLTGQVKLLNIQQ